MEKEAFVNFGCGGNILPSPWINHDIEVDITKPLPYADGSVRRVLAEHVVEHVTGPQGFGFMREVNRILMAGGVFRICVPELARLDMAKRADIICNHGHLVVFCEENLRLMLEAAGFRDIQKTGRDWVDGHHKVIGLELDTQETLRMIAYK